jgi:hypothetical protein
LGLAGAIAEGVEVGDGLVDRFGAKPGNRRDFAIADAVGGLQAKNDAIAIGPGAMVGEQGLDESAAVGAVLQVTDEIGLHIIENGD